MGLYLIGLGLTEDSISLEAKKILTLCDLIYLESYTVDFPYEIKELEKHIGKKITLLKREEIENESILKEAKKKKVALLIYGDPFSATTHTQLILSCKKQKIKHKVFHNSSILTAVAESGLSLYKFGKTASMPSWTEKYKPSSFTNYIKENQSIKAHTLLLVDIGLDFKKSLEQLENSLKKENIKSEEIVLCSRLGTKDKKVYSGKIKELKELKEIKKPFCFILPSEMHFIEKEALENEKV